MRRYQAEQYFEQLKQMHQQKQMTLAQMVNVLTGGAISVDQTNQFSAYVTSN